MLRSSPQTVIQKTISLPEYIKSLNNTVFLDVMQRDYVWLEKKSGKKTVEALIDIEVGEKTMDMIFNNRFSDLSDMLICKHKMDKNNPLDKCRYNKLLSSLDKDKIKKSELRGEKILADNYDGIEIDSLIDGNQRSTTLLLSFTGDIKISGKTKGSNDQDCSVFMKICEISTETGNSTREENVKLKIVTSSDCSFGGKAGYFFIDEDKEKKKLDCYIKLGYFYQRWRASQADMMDTFVSEKFNEIDSKIDSRNINHSQHSKSLVSSILGELYGVFIAFPIFITVYDNPSFDETIKLFLNRNSGTPVDNSDQLFAMLTRESFYNGDARHTLESTIRKIRAVYRITPSADFIFTTMYFMANRASNSTEKCPATMTEIKKNYNPKVHKELWDNYSKYEEILLIAFGIINRKNIHVIMQMSTVMFRLICRRIRYIMDTNSRNGIWSDTHHVYQDLVNEVLNFVVLARANKFFVRNSGQHNPFTYHVDCGGRLDVHPNLKKMTKVECETFLSVKSQDSISRMLIAIASQEKKLHDVLHYDHIFPKTALKKLFTDKEENLICNRILLSQRDNTSKNSKTPYEFFTERGPETRKEYFNYVVGIDPNGVVDPILNDTKNYLIWVAQQKAFRLNNLQGILYD